MFIILIRTILLYIVIIFALRLMGKRQLGELQPCELCIAILISNIASTPIGDPAVPMTWAIIPILVLVGFELLMTQLALDKPKLRKLMSGNPVVIISQGVIQQKELRMLRFSVDDLMETLRTKNIFDVKEVDYAVVETSGSVSILQKYDQQPITCSILGIQQDEKNNLSMLVINNGRIIEEGLRFYDLSKSWLEKILKKEKVILKDIFLMSVNQKHQYYIVTKQQNNI